MEHAAKRLTLFMIIFLSVIISVSYADEFVENSNYMYENKNLDLDYAGNEKTLDSPLYQSNSEDEFLLSHEIAQNQIIGINYAESGLNDKLIAEQESTLWLSLQLAF